MKKLLGILLILAGIFILFHTFVDHRMDWRWFADGKQNHRSAVIDGVENIRIEASASNVHIIPDTRENVTADLQGKGRVNIDRSGDTLKINVKYHWSNWVPFGGTTRLDVYVPERYNQNMVIHNGSGHLWFSGMSQDHPMSLDQLDIKMSSGKGDLRDLNVHRLEVDVSSGDLELRYLTAKATDLDFSSGRVELIHYVGPLNGKFSSGMLKAQFDQLKGDVDLDTSSGVVSVDLPKKADYTLDARASSGVIRSDLPLKNIVVKKRNALKGSYGTGKYDVRISVSSGVARIY
jgi:lia operon protein LiaG